jgi:hypothetical protein
VTAASSFARAEALFLDDGACRYARAVVLLQRHGRLALGAQHACARWRQWRDEALGRELDSVLIEAIAKGSEYAAAAL